MSPAYDRKARGRRPMQVDRRNRAKSGVKEYYLELIQLSMARL